MIRSKKGREIDQPLVELTSKHLEHFEQRTQKQPSGSFRLPRGYLSHSQIEMYLKCPRQYYFRYVCDEKRPPGVAMILGSGAHKAVEVTHHHLVDHQTPAPIEKVLDAYSDTFEKKAENIPETDWKKESHDRGAIKDVGVRLVTLYNKDFAPLVQPQVKNGIRGIEKEIKISIANIPIRGYIDLIDTNAEVCASLEERKVLQSSGTDITEPLRTAVVDFKTKEKSISQAGIDGSLQLTLYAFAEGIHTVRYDQLLKQKKPKVKRIYSQRTQQDYVWMHEIVTSVARAITAGIFPPCAPDNWACTPRWCGYWHMCRGKRR